MWLRGRKFILDIYNCINFFKFYFLVNFFLVRLEMIIGLNGFLVFEIVMLRGFS